MTVRTLKALFFLAATIVLMSLIPSSSLPNYAQPMAPVTSLAVSEPALGGPDPRLDASGNGGGEIPVEPSRSVETETATLIFSCNSPISGNEGLAWDGNYLWISDWDTKRAHKVDSASCQSLSSIPIPGAYPTGLAWDGTYLWHADAGGETIYQLSSLTGAVVSSFTSPGGFPQGLAWDGNRLWNSDTNCNQPQCTPDQIHHITTGGNVLATFGGIGPYPTGLAYDGQNLWHSDNATRTIYKLDPRDLSVLDSFPSPGRYPNDLAWDGRYLWIVDNGTDMLYQYDVGEPATTATEAYLPAVWTRWSGGYAYPCDEGNHYCEDNDSHQAAYGPVGPSWPYSAYPDDADDYYAFVLNAPRTVTINLHNYQATGDLVLYKRTASDDKALLAQWGKGGSEMEIQAGTLQAGTYYVRVYAAEGYPSGILYTLEVRY